MLASGCVSTAILALAFGALPAMAAGLTIMASMFLAQWWAHRNIRTTSNYGQAFDKALQDNFYLLRSDTTGRFIHANPKYLRRLGVTLSELAEQPMGGLSAGRYNDSHLAEMWSTVQAGQTWCGEFCDLAKDGSHVWISAVVIPTRDRFGRVQSLTTIGVDVSDLHEAQEAADTANARLQAFVKHAPTAIAMFDKQMNYVAHTDRWLQDYSLPEESLVGRNHYDVFPEVPEHWRLKHQRILAGATERSEEERFRRRDGTENVLRWEVRPWYLADATIGGMMMLTEEISERIKIKDRLWSLANLDALTSLPNRFSFTELLRREIETARADGLEFSVGLLDVDHLKEINDTLGHDVGDEVLKHLAARLKHVLADYGTIARLGGDEFAFLIRGTDVQIEAGLRAAEESFSEPLTVLDVPRICTASIGVTKFPDDAAEASDLLKNADLALYRAKSDGRARTVHFRSELRKTLRRKVEMQQQAQVGLSGDQFLLYFQPVVPRNLERPVSFEALLRWQHPILGTLTPPQFEEVFEDAKLAAHIGDRVIDMAIAQAKEWLDAGFDFERIAVNVTSADFALGDFADRLHAALERHGVGPNKICVEVTERVFLGPGSSHIAEALQRIKDMGVEIALDDFGTGYASLTHLKAFPIGRLKIDRSFVQDMLDNNDSLSIVKAIVQLANSLGIGVTAEGVETHDQLVLLSQIGCETFQGYLFSPARDPKELRPGRVGARSFAA